MTPTLWIDVEDLFAYAIAHQRPSGIQRVAFEISRTLHTRHGETGQVRFLRHDPVHAGFREVAWPQIAAMFSGLTETPAGPRRGAVAARPMSPGMRTSTPGGVRTPMLTGIQPHSRARQFVPRQSRWECASWCIACPPRCAIM